MRNLHIKNEFSVKKNLWFNLILFSIGAFIFAAFIIISGAGVRADSQDSLKGDWRTQKNTENPNSLDITLIRRLVKNSTFQTKIQAPFGEL